MSSHLIRLDLAVEIRGIVGEISSRCNSAEKESLQSQLALLEGRLRCAERWGQFHKIGWALFALLGLLCVEISPFRVVRAQSQQPQKLRIRELDIVDENGRERIVIAAPLPEAVVDGKVGHRVRVVSAAVQFKSPSGNEQGGIALSDDGSMIFGIDDERGHERAHLYYLPKRGSAVFFNRRKWQGDGFVTAAERWRRSPHGDDQPSWDDRLGTADEKVSRLTWRVQCQLICGK